MATAHFCAHCGAENQPGAALCHACQRSLEPPAAFQVNGGLLHARYQLLSQIGSGGFGAVYQARDTQHNGRLVAVKQIHLAGLSSQEIIEATDAFHREAQILSSLSHPLLPQIFDRFSDPQHWYLVMTLIHGQTLDEYLQQQQLKALPARAGLSLEETLSLALRLCDALSYLHSQQPPVIFRDLKPGNIMRTRDGQFYLIDFGIARRFKPGQARDTMPFGSPGFAAPEQYGKAQTTPQADLYSLGALLYCLLSGDDPSEHPFQFPSLRPCNTASLRSVNTLIQRLVALDPAQRPANIQEVQRELERIQYQYKQDHQQFRIWVPPQGQTPPPFPAMGSTQQHILPGSSSALGAQKPARRTTRRSLLTVGLVVGGLAAIVGGTEIVGTLISPSYKSIGTSLPNQETTDKTPAVPVNGPTFWSPDLSHAAITNLPKNQIEIYRSYSQQPIQVIKAPKDFVSTTINPTIQWSANNRMISTQSSSGRIYAWDVLNGQLAFTFTSAASTYSPGAPTIIAWSPDGEYCAFGYPVNNATDQNNAYINTALTILQTRNGKPSYQIHFPGYNNSISNILAWSPDSQYLAFPDSFGWRNSSSWIVDVWDRQTNQVSHSFSGLLTPDTDTTLITAIAWSSTGKQLATMTNATLWLNDFNNTQPVKAFITNFSSSSAGTFALWSPDGKYLAALSGETTLIACDLSSQQIVQLNSADMPNNFVTFTWNRNSQSITVVNEGNVFSHWPINQSLFPLD